jgi:DNA-binding transcriptional regulator YhcF (GntR family)
LQDEQPVFIQIMEVIENDILTNVYQTDDLIISTTQIAKVYSVNPATAVKAVGKLNDAGILYKKRGIGMCVTAGATERIRERRKDRFFNNTLDNVLAEAKMLGVSIEELIAMLKEKDKHDSVQ